MSTITILPDHVANQIAAGEVVQRPASVVKELLENSIDAGATKITLALVGSGKTSISVTDDGTGMDAEDAKNCFLRHATSKIKSADDLFQLTTRGFRGEAMASIGAVAHVLLRTNQNEEGLGLELKLEDSAVQSVVPYPWNKGTQVVVKNLFYNIPARRKFLKNERIELRHCIDEFHRVALVHSHIEWIMKSDENLLFHLKSAPLRQRITGIFGRKFDERLVPIQESTEVVQLEGFIIKPEFAKKKRGEQFFFVNGRYIKSPYLHNALREAFEDMLTGEHHPGYFLYLTVDPAEIDVNIHPTKTEIKFEDERAIYAVLRSAARHAIGQFNVAPTIDFDAEQSFSVPPLPEGQLPKAPQIKVNPNFNPFETTQSQPPRFRSDDEKYQRIQQEKYLNTMPSLEYSSEDEIKDFWNESPESPAMNEQTNHVLVWGNHMITLLGRKALIIDVFAARYRIFYDQFLEKLRNATLPSQQLLFPEKIQVGLSDQALLQEYQGWFATAGFDLRAEKNAGEFTLAGAPMLLAPEEAVPALEELLEQLKSLDSESIESALLKSFAKTLSKKAANSEFTKTKEALQALKEQLLSSSNPQYSPSGKKVIRELAPEDLESLL
ncbi:MAG TPA: DNA mismatch repair endonuclease MutL [Cryomorphaceae bacterium]|nr:MAG: DNA mismatch repair protein MutL [Flavobacteriales bacterium UBA4585]HBK19753.1 DNA mismatch repair endonuclease MutL [Cryomorphaceae bacterium]